MTGLDLPLYERVAIGRLKRSDLESHMKIVCSAALLAFASTSLWATPVYHPLGTSVVYGNMSNGRTISSPINNPAAGVSTMIKGDKVNFGVFNTIGGGVEYGTIDNLFEQIDEQVNSFYDITTPSQISDLNQIATEIDSSVDSLNSLMAEIAAEGYGKAFVSFAIPMMPVLVSLGKNNGVLTFDMNMSAVSRAELYHSDAVFNTNNILDPNDDVSFDPNTNTYVIDNDDTLLVRGASILELSMGYSREMLTNQYGTLSAGVRGKYYTVGLTRLNQRLADLQNGSETVFDNIDESDYTTDSDFGVDLGAMWIGKGYHLGAALTNINEPDFEYNDLVSINYDLTGDVYTQLAATNIYTMQRQLQLEASFNPLFDEWVTGVSVDANAVEDPFGDEYQWATISTAYISSNWIIPSARVGYRANLAGQELDYITVGLTLFKVTLDLAYGLEEVKIDDTKYPRSFIFNIGLDLMF